MITIKKSQNKIKEGKKNQRRQRLNRVDGHPKESRDGYFFLFFFN